MLKNIIIVIIKQFLTFINWSPWYIKFLLYGDKEYFNIPTHMTKVERLLLYKLAISLPRNSIIVEIGSYLGASSIFLASAAKRRKSVVYCVDTWKNDAMSEGERDTFDEFCKNIEPLRSYVRILRGKSVDMAKIFNKKIDLIFIDADHSYEACSSDAKAWLPKVKPGGIVIFHDIAWAEGVQRTVQEMVKPLEQSRGHVMGNIYWARIDS